MASPVLRTRPRMPYYILPILASLVSPAWLPANELVYFDVPSTIGCRDVTTAEFLATNPYERLVEARFQVSTLLRTAEDDLVQFLYRIDYPTFGVEIVDYFPKTTMDPTVAGNVGIERKTEDAKNVGITLTGTLDHLVGTGSAGASTKVLDSIKYDLLPPMDMVAAAGTLNRRASVYFKLKPTPRASLEGGKELVVVFRVPQGWRGQYVYVRCQAQGNRRTTTPPFEERAVLGDRVFLVALYGDGDLEAKSLAVQFAQSELKLRNAALAQRRRIERQSYPTVAHKFGALLTVVDPKIPENWLDEILQAPAAASPAPYLDRLPSPVKTATDEYLLAKRNLASLGQPAN